MTAPTASRLESFKELIRFADRPALGSKRRGSALTEAVVREQTASWLKANHLEGRAGAILLGAALLWHDHLLEAHAIAQNLEDAEGGFLHAIMHRREPDFWNSKYWWNRVGTHPCFRRLAGRVLELLAARGEEELVARLLPNGRWNAAAFVDACEASEGEPAGSPLSETLIAVQALELECLVEHVLGSAL